MNIQSAIQAELDRIVDQHTIRILYCCESGSRAWGFPSPDSDYDVRFIYAHPRDHYLSVREHKDTLDFPIDEELDVNGWDIRKTLGLIAGSNATPLEWLQSPIIYREEPGVREKIFHQVAQQFNPDAARAHYLGLTRGSLRKLESQGEASKLKTWFYVFRPLFAARWIVEKQTPPPMAFAPLRSVNGDAQLDEQIEKMLELKKDASEAFTMPPPAGLADQIEACMGELYAAPLPKNERNYDALDEVFRELIQ